MQPLGTEQLNLEMQKKHISDVRLVRLLEEKALESSLLR